MKLTLDTAQMRRNGDRLSVMIRGEQFSSNLSVGTYIDPICNRLMLRPYILHPEWVTSNSGNYAKIGISGFSFGDATKWEERADQHIKGNWICTIDNEYHEPAITNTIWPDNCGVYLAFFVSGSGTYKVLSAGYGPTAESVVSISFDVYSNGNIKVFKNNVEIGEGSVSSSTAKTRQKSQTSTGDTQQNRVLEIAVVPCGKNEIIFYSPSSGNGFVVSIPDVENGIIVPQDKFWVSFKENVTQFLFSPIKYPMSGYSISQTGSFFEAPIVTDTFEVYDHPILGPNKPFRIAGDNFTTPITVTLYNEAGTDEFVKNASNVVCRLKTELTTESTYLTPCVYMAEIAFNPLVNYTDDSQEVDITHYLEDISLEVNDTTGEISLAGVIKKPDDPEVTIDRLEIISNRPCRFEYLHKTSQNPLVIEGRFFPQKKSYMHNFWTLDFEIYGPEFSLKTYRFVEELVLDGMNLADALKFILRFGNFDEDYDFTTSIEPTSFVIGDNPTLNANESNYLIEAGKTPLEIIQDLINTFANNWIWGFRPLASGYEFFAGSREFIGDESLITVWCDDADIDPEENDVRLVNVRKIDTAYLPIESNDVRITWQDPISKDIGQVFKRDVQSILADVAPNLRPDNWWGEFNRVGYSDGNFTSEQLAIDVLRIYYPRLAKPTRIAEIEGAFYYSAIKERFVWKGDRITLVLDGVETDFVITNIAVKMVKHITKDAEVVFRADYATYQLEEI